MSDEVSDEDIIERIRACPGAYELVQAVLDSGTEVDCSLLVDRDGAEWIFIESETCGACGLPNISAADAVENQHRILLRVYCKDCMPPPTPEPIN